MDINSLRYVLIMKVGFHTDETLEEIMFRKREESTHGPFFWGYGGTVCHPKNQVQPFAEEAHMKGYKIYLLMTLTPSNFTTSPIVSTHYSPANDVWHEVPDYALITGSKYALVCRDIYEVNTEIDLNQYIVGVGPKKGTNLSNYLRKRVDKACAIYMPQLQESDEKKIQVQYVSELVEPYSVFLSSGDPDEKFPRQLRLIK